MNHFQDDLAVALDAPHFAKLLLRLTENSVLLDGIPVSRKVAQRYEETRENYLEELTKLRKAKFIVAAIEARQSPSLIHELRTAQSHAEFPFFADETLMRPVELSDISVGLENVKSTILPIANLLFPNSPCFSLDDLIKILKASQKRSKDEQIQIRQSLGRILLHLVRGSVSLKQIESIILKVTEAATPIANRYVDTLTRYMSAVVESLYLKLQFHSIHRLLTCRIVEMETKLQIYDHDLVKILQRTDRVANSVIGELEQTIRLGQTNLLLFQQLGPSVGKIATQYQQLLCQIELVKEDIAQLS
jgi:hypothetical protein